jgi:ankyrin repeat protein
MKAALIVMAVGALGFSAPSSPVADAAMKGDVAAVRALIANRSDVNVAQGDGMTALHWAARRGNAELAALLLRAKADVKATTRIGALTPLHLAAEAGSDGVVVALLDAGADAKSVDATGVTALHFASLAGNVGAVGALLDRGAPVNATEPAWEHTPLMFAAARGRTEAVRLLLKRGANPSASAKVVKLMDLVAQDRATRQRRNFELTRARAEQKEEKNPSWRPDPATVQRAVKAALEVERRGIGAPPTAADDSMEAVLRAAASGGGGGDDDPPGYPELVAVQGGLTALHLAVREGFTETAMALVDGGASVDLLSPADKTTPLLLATINGHFDLAKALLARGANPKLASEAGATPLYAVINKEWAPSSRTPQPTFNLQQQTSYLELMEALLKAGADPNARLAKSLWYTTYNRDNLRVDFRGATAFWRAAYATDIPAMKLLLKHGANPTLATIKPPPRAGRGGRGGDAPAGGADVPVRLDPSGLPPVPEGGVGVPAIVAAAGVGYGQGYAANDHRHAPDSWLPAVKFLVEELKADVNARDANGHTALHFAAARGDNELIRYLVSKGADPKAVARNGQTTVDMANGPVQRISPYLDTVALLESMGAKNNHKCVAC